MAPPMAPFQVLISTTNTTLGAGTSVGLKGIVGLRDLPNMRQGNVDRGQQDGMFPGLNYIGERTVAIDYQITATATAAETALALASASHQNISDPASVCLTAGDYLRQVATLGTVKPVAGAMVQLPGRTYPLRFFGRPTRFSAQVVDEYQYGQINIATEWSCPDGLLYDDNLVTAFCGLPNPTSGAKFPSTFNVAFGSSSGGSFQLNNTGKYRTSPYFTITGPVSYPLITNQTTAQQILLNIVIVAGETLSVDCQSGTVTLNGVANRNNVVDISTTFFPLVPGVNTIAYGSLDSTAVTSKLTGYALPAYSVI